MRYQRGLGFLLVAVSAAGFSGKSILIKLAYLDQVDSLTLLTLRMVFALPFFLLVFFRPGSVLPSRRDLLSLVFLGFIGYYLASLFDFIGLEYIPASLERLILFIYPTLVLLLSYLFYGKKISRKEGIASGITYAGLCLLFFQESILGDSKSLTGVLYVLGSALAYAVYLIGAGRMVHRTGALQFTAVALSVSSFFALVHYALRQIWIERSVVPDLPVSVYFYALAMAVFSTVIPAFALSAGIKRIGSAHAAIIATVGPVVTMLLAWYYLDESVSPGEIAGTAAILCGVFLLGYQKPESKMAQQTAEKNQ